MKHGKNQLVQAAKIQRKSVDFAKPNLLLHKEKLLIILPKIYLQSRERAPQKSKMASE